MIKSNFVYITKLQNKPDNAKILKKQLSMPVILLQGNALNKCRNNEEFVLITRWIYFVVIDYYTCSCG